MSKKTTKYSKGDPFRAREKGKYEHPIPSREFILHHLKQLGQPRKMPELLDDLNLTLPRDAVALKRRLRAMVRDDQLEHLRGRGYWPSGQRILLKGRVMVEKGQTTRGFVIPEEGGPRVLVSLQDVPAVYPGYRVVVSTTDTKGQGPREGRVVEILETAAFEITGRFIQEANASYVIPHSKEVSQEILIPPGKDAGAKDGHIVVVRIAPQQTRISEPNGTIIEILGHEDSAGIEVRAVSRAYGLPEDWPEAVEDMISTLKETVSETAKKDRLDLRDLPLITIDGEDAKDFDDAVFCEPLPRGAWRLYVAIADVSYYVEPGTPLDEEAKMRGNSVYFPSKVIPMLPEKLSNGLCSLNPNVDRLCMVCIMQISNAGKMTQYSFHEAVMQSKARMTYTKVAALLSGQSPKLAEQYQEILPHVQNLNQLYQVLRQEREQRGAIEFETVETRIIFDPQGKINRIEPVHRNEAHRIIEECMLSANVATARFLKKHKLPALYRNHEGPPPDKLADLRLFLNELGLSLGGGKEPKPLDYAKLLRSIQNRPDLNVIQTVLLRSLSQAVYSPDNLGHFGLAYPAYCHFTSPIRRYPDLLVHRQIKTVLRNEWTEKLQKKMSTEEAVESFISLGDHLSTTERRADDATRDVARWLKCHYIRQHIGKSFEGIISGVTRFGFFVELKDLYIDGLVHVNNLKNDYYYFDPVHHRMIGERTGIVYRLGDTLQVKVAKVDVDDRKIDFEVEQEPTPPSSKELRKQRRGKRDHTAYKNPKQGDSASFKKPKPKHKHKHKTKKDKKGD